MLPKALVKERNDALHTLNAFKFNEREGDGFFTFKQMTTIKRRQIPTLTFLAKSLVTLRDLGYSAHDVTKMLGRQGEPSLIKLVLAHTQTIKTHIPCATNSVLAQIISHRQGGDALALLANNVDSFTAITEAELLEIAARDDAAATVQDYIDTQIDTQVAQTEQSMDMDQPSTPITEPEQDYADLVIDLDMNIPELDAGHINGGHINVSDNEYEDDLNASLLDDLSFERLLDVPASVTQITIKVENAPLTVVHQSQHHDIEMFDNDSDSDESYESDDSYDSNGNEGEPEILLPHESQYDEHLPNTVYMLSFSRQPWNPINNQQDANTDHTHNVMQSLASNHG